MLSGAKRNRNISDFSGRLRFLASLGMTLGICEIFNAQVLIDCVQSSHLNKLLSQTTAAVLLKIDAKSNHFCKFT